MNNTMSKEAFAEKVCEYMKEVLPEELAEAEVRTTSLDLWADVPHMVLLIIRPWDNAATGFCLDRWYREYQDKKETAETAAAIINDRRLCCMPQGDVSDQVSAIIYA